MKTKKLILPLIFTAFFNLTLFSCNTMEKKATIWSTIHVNYTKASGRGEKDETFVNDTVFIQESPLAVKTIIAYFAQRYADFSGDSELTLARALGGFSSLQEACASLLRNKEHIFEEIKVEGSPANFEIEIEENTVRCEFSGVWGSHSGTYEFNITKNGNVEYVNPNKRNPNEPSYYQSIIKIDNQKIYLQDLYRISKDSYSHYEELKPLGKGDYFLRYEITSGNYPEEYTTELCYLHIIPEKNKMRLETCFIVRWFGSHNKTTGSESRSGERIDIQKNGVFERTEYSPQWEFVGYSTDKNNLYAEIYKFYKTYK